MNYSKLKTAIKNNPVLYKVAHLVKYPIYKIQVAAERRPIYKKELDSSLAQLGKITTKARTIWFCGVPTHNNLGDQAQAQCIRAWISENFDSSYRVVELLAFPFYSKKFKEQLDKLVLKDDIFIIQSGYCTSESHYNHYMHRYIASHFDNPVLIMPQTVNFHKEKEGFKTGEIYKKHKKLLFLARDRQSYEYAKKYFSDCELRLYPDIVTSMIGTHSYGSKRSGVLICVRNDGEKLYTTEQISQLRDMFKQIDVRTEITDTNYTDSESIKGVQTLIDEKIRQFSTYQAVITDRYHGTIFSMIANTPVIVLATNDHKVKTGTEWFKGIYDGAFYNAASIEEAYKSALKIIDEGRTISNPPYFKENYFDRLYTDFYNIIN